MLVGYADARYLPTRNINKSSRLNIKTIINVIVGREGSHNPFVYALQNRIIGTKRMANYMHTPEYHQHCEKPHNRTTNLPLLRFIQSR